jgi:hypothetical protein
MTKVSLRKLSVLGLVLMAASAVTAAIVPSKAKDLKQVNSDNNGILRDASGAGTGGGVDSCVNGDDNFDCHVTANTKTGNESENLLTRTAGNTSHSNSNDSADTTSAVS